MGFPGDSIEDMHDLIVNLFPDESWVRPMGSLRNNKLMYEGGKFRLYVTFIGNGNLIIKCLRKSEKAFEVFHKFKIWQEAANDQQTSI